MTTKPTSGKWTVSKHDDNGDIVIRTKKDNSIIANLSVDSGLTPNSEILANAKIMAASKDLLKALQGILNDFTDYTSEIDDADWKLGDEGSWTTNIFAARAAIEKATK